VTLEPTLNEISGLTKMSVKHKGGGKYLGRNATSFTHQENQQEKKEHSVETFRVVNVFYFTFLQKAL